MFWVTYPTSITRSIWESTWLFSDLLSAPDAPDGPGQPGYFVEHQTWFRATAARGKGAGTVEVGSRRDVSLDMIRSFLADQPERVFLERLF